VQDFLAKSPLCQRTQFTLVDFNDETLMYTGKVLNELKAKHQRATSIQMVKKSVVQLLKEAAKPGSNLFASRYDFVYCAGLFDYLPDHVCEKLMSIFYDLLAPGGLLVATNVEQSNPNRNWMEYSVDWHLVYRDHRRLGALRPKGAAAAACSIKSDATGVNLFMEVRKPEDE
jgi:extracellular factor (EF) 3-hydroxypalmitic acid methyl ester biosynthesis protein